jgi:hypothetical protein
MFCLGQTMRKNKELLIDVSILSFNFKNFISLEYTYKGLNSYKELLLTLEVSLELLIDDSIIDEDQMT